MGGSEHRGVTVIDIQNQILGKTEMKVYCTSEGKHAHGREGGDPNTSHNCRSC